MTAVVCDMRITSLNEVIIRLMSVVAFWFFIRVFFFLHIFFIADDFISYVAVADAAETARPSFAVIIRLMMVWLVWLEAKGSE